MSRQDAPLFSHVEEYEVPDASRGALRYSITLVLATLGVVAIIIGANILVDPRDDFGTEFYVPALDDKVATKLHLYESLRAPPDVVLVGTSRILEINATHLAAAGMPGAYNFGIPLSSPYDHTLVYRYLVGQGNVPSVLIQSIDTPGAGDPQWPDWDVIPSSQAAGPFTGEYRSAGDWLRVGTESLSRTYLRDTFYIMYLTHYKGYPLPLQAFNPDGSADYPHFENLNLQGRWNQTRHIENHISFRMEKMYQFLNRFDPDKIATLQEQVRATEENGTEFYLFFPPVHPYGQELLDASVPDWREKKAALREILVGMCRPHMHLMEFTDIGSFGGNPEEFRDAVHYYGDNARLLAEAIVEKRGDLCAEAA